jgi:hypothetical protein
MELSSGAKFLQDGINTGNAGQQHIYQRPFSWVRKGIQKATGSFLQPSQCPTLPKSNPCPATTNQTPMRNGLQQQLLYMMTCMHRGRRGKTVYQDRIESIATDRQLFEFWNAQYVRYRGKIKTAFSLHGVQGIFFVKVSNWLQCAQHAWHLLNKYSSASLWEAVSRSDIITPVA